MFEVITLKDEKKFRETAESFENYDIYYLPEYFKSLERYCQAECLMFHYLEGDFEACYVMFKNDIARCEKFEGNLELGKYFDMETPYGYGGALCVNYSEEQIEKFFGKVSEYAAENNIITQFLRFNPLTDNSKLFSKVCTVINEKSTVYMDLTSKEKIDKNLDSKNRNVIRKAVKNGITVRIMTDGDQETVKSEFKRLYKSTMDRNNADGFYYFDDDYFKNFFLDMGGRVKVFYAEMSGRIISVSLIMCCNGNLHYFLSANDRGFMNLAPNNLLLYEVAKWGNENGFSRFHLGGGVSDNDRLFSFKKAFNKNGILNFAIGRNIFNQEAFDRLVNFRKELDPSFDTERKFLIKYRQ